jgi:hypothetical protein
MSRLVTPQPTPTAKKVMDAIVAKMQTHANDLDEGKTGNIRWRKQKGQVEVDITTTK